MTLPWSDDVDAYASSLCESSSSILLGRKLAEGFIPAWESMADEPGADFMNQTHRVVVTNTLTESPWHNAELVHGELKTIVHDFKETDGTAVVYGGVMLLSSLIAEGLIDELHLFVNPVAIGRGMPVFGRLEGNRGYDVQSVTLFTCGITALKLIPAP